MPSACHRRSNRSSRPLLTVLFASLAAPGCWQSHDTVPGPDAGTRPDAGGMPVPDAALPVDGGALDAGGCPPAQGYYVPGCGSGEDVRIEAGCYQPCTGAEDTSCGAATICRRTDINPCVCGPDEPCCAACGAEQWLCLPPPTPTGPCEGRSYCDCAAADGCEPLIDLTSGCICPCDEPFSCGGPPCDCACGGARYLGCAAIGACDVPEIYCGPGCVAQLAACPSCACDG